MAASDSCVPNLYADALESRANHRAAGYGRLVRSVATIAPAAADLLAAVICTFLVYSLSSGPALSFKQRMIASVIVGIVAALSRAQRQESTICNLIQVRETEAVLRSAVLSQLCFLCVNLLLGKHLPAWAYAFSLCSRWHLR